MSTLVYETGKPARIDYENVTGTIGKVAATVWGLGSSVGVPVIMDGRTWGSLVVALSHRRVLPAVSIRAEIIGKALALTLHDDGVGGADPTRGTGLVGLKDRVEALGGLIRIESPQGTATILRAELPFTEP